jgi:hypothetical protein
MKLSMPGVCSEGGIRNAEIKIRATAKQTRTNGITTVGVDALDWVLSRSRDIGFGETNMQGLLSGSYWLPDSPPRQELSVPRVILRRRPSALGFAAPGLRRPGFSCPITLEYEKSRSFLARIGAWLQGEQLLARVEGRPHQSSVACW